MLQKDRDQDWQMLASKAPEVHETAEWSRKKGAHFLEILLEEAF